MSEKCPECGDENSVTAGGIYTAYGCGSSCTEGLFRHTPLCKAKSRIRQLEQQLAAAQAEVGRLRACVSALEEKFNDAINVQSVWWDHVDMSEGGEKTTAIVVAGHIDDVGGRDQVLYLRNARKDVP